MRIDRKERALGSSVCHFDLKFHVGRAAVRLPADPPQRAEGQPEDVPKQKGFSDEHRSRKYEAVRLQVLLEKKKQRFIPTRRRKEAAYFLAARK